MSRATNLRASRSTDYPRNAWYVLATSAEVGRDPLGPSSDRRTGRAVPHH